MIFKWDTVYLSDASTARAYAITVNGRQLVQEAQFLRAESAAFFGRKNRRLSIAFSVRRNFETIKLAEQWMLGHHSELTHRATLTITTGQASETQEDIVCQDAVLESVDFPVYRGILVEARYQFLVPSITGTGPTPTHDDNLITGSFDIPSGADSVTVDDLDLIAAPTRVFCTVRKPSADAFTIIASPVDGSFATTGFTAALSAETDSADYILDYALVL